MLYIGVDLAERHSAAVALDDSLGVVYESAIDAGPAQAHPYPAISAYRGCWQDIAQGIWKAVPTVEDWCDCEPGLAARSTKPRSA